MIQLPLPAFNVMDLHSVFVIVPTVLFVVFLFRLQKRGLGRIPTVGGPSLPILSYYGTFKSIFHTSEVLQEGYNKYKDGAFKHATFTGWAVVVSGRLVDELQKADHTFSFRAAINQELQAWYTLGSSIHDNQYHIPVLRTQVMRNLDKLCLIVHDELVAAFDDGIVVRDGEWTSVRASEMTMKVVARASNRMLVGLKCRDADYCELGATFAIDVLVSAKIICLFPAFLKPIVARVFGTVEPRIDRMMQHLEPIISERFRMAEEYGNEWTDKPTDFLQWLIDVAEDDERNVRALTLRILAMNLASIHTTSNTFMFALYYLAVNPQYMAPLREEVDAAVRDDGWTRGALQKMPKVDSFIKESMRVSGPLGATAIDRLALKDFTFSDGTFIPAGTHVCAVLRAAHHDDAVYADADTFDPWRFSRTPDGKGAARQIVSTSIDFLSFGHGRYACPGRFFAANKLKMMLAHIVATYDVKMENEGVMPPVTWIGRRTSPNKTARVLFRRRQN